MEDDMEMEMELAEEFAPPETDHQEPRKEEEEVELSHSVASLPASTRWNSITKNWLSSEAEYYLNSWVDVFLEG